MADGTAQYQDGRLTADGYIRQVLEGRRGAHTIDRDRITVARARGDRARCDHDARVLATLFNLAYAAEFFDDSGEHFSLLAKELSPSDESDQDKHECDGERRHRKDDHPDRFVLECEAE